MIARTTADPIEEGYRIRSRRLLRPLLVLAGTAMTFASSPALAWGDDGHRVVALVAYELLTPNARAAVDRLLARDTDPLTLPDIASRATWADHYRDSNIRQDHYRQTAKWHFTDIELNSPDLASACYGFPSLPAGVAAAGPAAAANDCAANKIAQFADELGNPGTPDAERILALKFVLHLVGDLHQPLHSSDDHDAGGNCEQVMLSPGSAPLRLHHYWDIETVQGVLAEFRASSRRPDATLADLAHSLAKGSSSSRRHVAAGNARQWTLETFKIAQRTAYALPRHPACPVFVSGQPQPAYTPFLLSATYQRKAIHTAREQLSKAAIRLGNFLNQLLDQRNSP